MTQKPRLLILSFSKLATDARILKQIHLFADKYDVTTCGHGSSPSESVRHIPVEPEHGKTWKYVESVLLRTRRYRSAYWVNPVMREAKQKLSGQKFDVVIANDLDSVGVALTIAPAELIHADLHEYWPGIHDNIPNWVKLRAPFHKWMLRKWATQAASATTVNQAIADRYAEEVGIKCKVVPNASKYLELEPGETHNPLRLVHSGGAQPSRKIELMMTAVAKTSANVILDLYLVGEGTEYYRQLVALADELGERVRILPPVAHHELVSTLNTYDAGLTFLPPTSTNNAIALPNKFFDYIQARVGVIAGPTPAMAELIEQHGVGAVTDSFDESALVQLLDGLTVSQVTEWKQRSQAAAVALSAERQSGAWSEAVDAIAPTKKGSAA